MTRAIDTPLECLFENEVLSALGKKHNGSLPSSSNDARNRNEKLINNENVERKVKASPPRNEARLRGSPLLAAQAPSPFLLQLADKTPADTRDAGDATRIAK